MLSQSDAEAQTLMMLKVRETECAYLNRIRSYWKGRQPLPIVPVGTPVEVRTLASMSRINVVELVVDVQGQSLFVDGYRSSSDQADSAAWAYWQANKMDARQTGVHRAAAAYGTSYVLVMPGDPVPVFRGISPRYMTTLYGEDPTWPMWGLEVISSNGSTLYRLYDQNAVYYLDEDTDGRSVGQDYNPRFLDVREHNLGFNPIIRFEDEVDLDDDDAGKGQIDQLMPLQDQMDITTFGLLVAQWYAAFRQRYIIGWTSDNENQKAKAAASHLWTFDDDAKDIKIGEFEQTQLDGYLGSREATLSMIGMLSQTPPSYLLGRLVNLSADALAFANQGETKKLGERETLYGESWEQVFQAASIIEGVPVDVQAEVRWRDSEARALASTVDALGKMAQMLGVPVQMLWEKIPGWTDQDVERAKELASSTDAFAQLNALLSKQAGADGGTAGGGNPGAPAA